MPGTLTREHRVMVILHRSAYRAIDEVVCTDPFRGSCVNGTRSSEYNSPYFRPIIASARMTFVSTGTIPLLDGAMAAESAIPALQGMHGCTFTQAHVGALCNTMVIPFVWEGSL